MSGSSESVGGIAPRRDPREMAPLSHIRLAVALVLGAATAAVVARFAPWQAAPAAGWGVTAGTYVVWVWAVVWRLDADDTSRFATREDPSRAVADALLLAASVISLGAVGLMLIKAGDTHGAGKNTLVASSVASVILSWILVHTVFTLHYAHLYYSDVPGGVDFNEDDAPRYGDFAYLAFTIGMTFQVSDTNLQSKRIRATALRHALLSFLFGAVILATTINLVAALLK